MSNFAVVLFVGLFLLIVKSLLLVYVFSAPPADRPISDPLSVANRADVYPSKTTLFSEPAQLF